MTIANWIEKHAEFSPTKIALRFESRFEDRVEDSEFTYHQLAAKIRSTATMLKHDLGITSGDRVAFLGYNSPEFLIVFFACARLGAIFVPLNWRLTPPEHLYMLQDSGSKVLFLESDFAHLIPFVLLELPTCQVVGLGFTPDHGRSYATLMTSVQDEASEADAGLEDPVLIVYTSGTTGHPKGAVLTQNAVFWNTLNNIHLHDMTSEDHVLTVCPLFHVAGLNVQTTPAFYVGATVTLHRYFHPNQVLLALSNDKPTLTHLVPSMIDALIRSPRWSNIELSTLRTLSAGSTTVPQHLCDAFRAKGVPVGIIYGATETSPLAIYLRSQSEINKVNSVGLAALHCQIRLVDELGQAVPSGQVGEILVKGPNVMVGYWKNPEATAQSLRDGWYHTGDMAYCDEDGYYYIADRKKNLIITGGENIYPSEVERVLLEHTAIEAVAVVGVPDERWQEIPVAVIVPTSRELSENMRQIEDEWHAFMSDKLAAYKRPHHFFLVDELPKNALGKVQHFRVREALLEHPEFAITTTTQPSAQAENAYPQHNHDSKTEAELRLQLQQATIDEKQTLLLSYLRSQIAQSLGISIDEVDTERPLSQMGYDSFGAVHLHYQIGTLGADIPLTRLLERISVRELLNEIVFSVSDVSRIATASAISTPEMRDSNTKESVEYPASYIQQHWYELCEEIAPHNPLFGQLIHSFRIRSEVDILALREAFQIISERHDALRTTFRKENGQLWQLIQAEAKVDFTVVDACTGAALEEQIVLFTQQAYDLALDAMLQARLFTLASDHHILIIKVHHLAADGWSMWVLFDELRSLYHALSNGLPSVPEVEGGNPSESHLNFAQWYNQTMQGETGERLWSYWQRQLTPEPAYVQLPYDHLPKITSHMAQVFTLHFDQALTEKLRALAQAEGITLYMLLLAGFQTLLHSYAEQEDIAVVSSFPNRTNRQFYYTVGFLAGVTIIRTPICKTDTFQTHLRQVQRDLLGALEHQAYPVSLLQERLNISREPTQRLFSPVYFAYLRQHIFPEMADLYATDEIKQIDFGGLRMERFPSLIDFDWCGYPLDVQLIDRGKKLSGLFIYNQDIFKEATIRTMTDKFKSILAAVVERPQLTISELVDGIR
ncbi:MAG: long-chain-fatty-acid--CoA ligase [Ardenticatenaceae bacterium]